MNRPHIVLPILVLTLLPAFLLTSTGTLRAESPAPEAESDNELWYTVELAGQNAGWVMMRESLEDGTIVTESRMHMEIRRGPSRMTLATESRFYEKDGKPLRAWMRQSLGQMPVESTWVFRKDAEGDVVEVTTVQGDTIRESEQPAPSQPWLTPAAAEETIRRHLADGTSSFVLNTVDPQLGLTPIETTWTLVEKREEIVTPEGTVTTSRWRQTQSYAPQIEILANVDAEGRLVRSITPVLGMNTTILRSTRKVALLQSGAAPELLVRTFLKPDREIADPRRVRRAVYELVHDGETPLELPNLGFQKSEPIDGGVRLVVGERDAVEDSAGEDSAKDAAAYLRSTVFLPHDDPVIRGLLREVNATSASSAERAAALRDFVAGYVREKDLDTVLATASEVATTRSGDCTEHSVLLAALLRASGIPSRIVTGLVYVERFVGQDDIFGYHMWTQALLDGRWVDTDATLGGGFFDATHIALGTSALDDEQSILQEVAKIAGLLGRLEIRVLEVEHSAEQSDENER